jgi:uncharacterized protein (DUF736 family)
MNKNSALIIGSFQSTETGFTGKLDTLAIKANLTLQPNDDKEKDNQPDFIMPERDRRGLESQ